MGDYLAKRIFKYRMMFTNEIENILNGITKGTRNSIDVFA